MRSAAASREGAPARAAPDRLRGALAAIVLALLPATVAQAHEPVFVHPWLTREAALLFAARFPDEAAETQEFVVELTAGATHEDDYFADADHLATTMRSGRHFYRPADGAGITAVGTAYESSYTWGAVANPGNEWDWQDALDRYRAGDRAAAHYALGHVLHLLQDLTVPAHVHLDEHGLPNGDDYENYAWFRCSSDTSCDLPRPPADVDFPALASTATAWAETASATYWRAMYPGDLSNHERPAGQIAVMFPNLTWSPWSSVWYVEDPPLGDAGVDFFEREPGWFYFKNLEVPAAADRAAFSARAPQTMQFAANPDGKAMAELVARDLIPLAIVDSVRLLRLFVAEASQLEPLPPAPPTADEPAGGCATLVPRGAAVVLVPLGMLMLVRRRGRAS